MRSDKRPAVGTVNTIKIFLDEISLSGSLFSREPRLYKRVCPSVDRSVGPSVGPSAGGNEPANSLFRAYKLVQ